MKSHDQYLLAVLGKVKNCTLFIILFYYFATHNELQAEQKR